MKKKSLHHSGLEPGFPARVPTHPRPSERDIRSRQGYLGLAFHVLHRFGPPGVNSAKGS